jgi:hypothetical protein
MKRVPVSRRELLFPERLAKTDQQPTLGAEAEIECPRLLAKGQGHEDRPVPKENKKGKCRS